MKTRIRLGIIVSFFLAFPSICHGEDALTCDVSGSWNSDARGVSAAGVLCQWGGAHRIYRFDDVSSERVKGAYAPFYANDGRVRYLFSDAAQKAFYYADDGHVYVVDGESYRITASEAWSNVQVVEQDPYDPVHRAIIHDVDDGRAVRLISHRSGEIADELIVPLSGDLLGVHWTPDRFVVVEAEAMHIYRRSPDSYRNSGLPAPDVEEEKNSKANDPSDDRENADNSEQGVDEERGADDAVKDGLWNGDTIPFERPLTRDDYRCDPNGVMVWDKAAKRLSYYVFAQRRWTRATINATASIRGIGESASFAFGVTNDMSTVRIVARMGSFLQNRYEAKYWKLSNDPMAPLAVGESNAIALDGGSDNRAQIIDTRDMTWRRIALISYPAPGRLAELSHGLLATIHPGAAEALIVWHARSGEKRAALSQNQLDDAGLAEISRVETIDAMPRYKVVFDTQGKYALFDSELSTLSKAVPATLSPGEKLPQNFILASNAVVLPHGDKAGQWAIYTNSTGADGATVFDVASSLQTPLANMLSPKDKWYGYSDGSDVYAPRALGTVQNRENPAVNTIKRPSHRPIWLAWCLGALSVLGIVGVMAWRNGWGKASKLSTDNENGTNALIIDIFDKKKRRMITDRDIHYFIEENFYSKRYFRILLSSLSSLGISIIVALPYFRDDTFDTFVSWVLVLSAPVFAFIWILVSWTYWNRRYLLRYGRIVEGKWLNCAKPNQSIAYVPEAGKSFELSRNQWRRADYVPIVIFDPRRPNFAIQYTGESEHALTALNLDSTVQDPPKGASCFDVFRLFVVLLVLVGVIVATQIMFHAAYPGSLSEWRLQETSKSRDFELVPATARVCDSDCAEGETTDGSAAENCEVSDLCRDVAVDKDARIAVPQETFTVACLKLCRDGDEMCHEQCHTRQLLNILTKAGCKLDATLAMTPSEFLQARRESIALARKTIFDASLSCGERAQRISDIAMWSDDLYASFFSIYGDYASFHAARLEEISNQIAVDAEVFRRLCDPSCAMDSRDCLEPPACPGGIERLKSAVCAFYDAIGASPIPGEREKTTPPAQEDAFEREANALK